MVYKFKSKIGQKINRDYKRKQRNKKCRTRGCVFAKGHFGVCWIPIFGGNGTFR